MAQVRLRCLLAVIAVSGLVSSCGSTGVGNAIQPLESEPHAVLAFTKAPISAGVSQISYYFSKFDDKDCLVPETGTFAALLSFLTPDQVPIRVSSGREIFIRSSTVVSSGTVVASEIGVASNWCTTVGSFTPHAGHRYAIKHFRSGNQCHLDVSDEDGRPVTDLKVWPVTEFCKFRLQQQDLR